MKEQLGAEERKPQPRIGHTEKELSDYLALFPEDRSLAEAAEFIKTEVTEWGFGKSTEDVLRAVYRHYRKTDGLVSEATSTMLMQAATLWFGYEAQISNDVDGQIREEILRED